VVGLLPGSRPGEVKRHLPLFIETARLLSARIPGIRFVLFAAPSLSNEYYDRVLAENGAREGFPYLMELVRDENFEWRASLDLALTCSGSATLENALLGVPMVVVYKMSWVTYALARRLANVSNIAMANILAGEALVPELIQDQARPEALAEESVKILKDLDGRRDLRQRLLALRLKLGGPGASRRAAEEILKGL
jgi:lipid-A-disaccharide synthase